MDSGNSGSMQSSSSGEEEEFDSRAESISAFLSNHSNPFSHVGPMTYPLPQQPPPASEHHHTSTAPSMFDPLSNYFGPLSSASRSPLTAPLTNPSSLPNPSSLLSLDVWSKNLRSEPSCTDLGGFMASSSSPTQQFFTKQTQTRTSFPSAQVPPGAESAARVSISGSNANDQSNISVSCSSKIGRNPKKRSRASRRAPTTVLTTDTTNFRAMVQEFTGIPAPPFTSSPFPRTRLDLFGAAASTLRSAATHLDFLPPPSYLLRPFAQKVQPPPPPPPEPPFLSPPPPLTSLSTTVIIDAIAPTTTTNIDSGTNNITTSSSTSVNYQLPSDLGLLKMQPQNNLLNINMQTPVLNFHSLLQSHPSKYPLPGSAILGTAKTSQASFELPSNDSHLKIGGLENIGLGHSHIGANLAGLQNIVSSSSSDTPLHRSDSNPAKTSDGVGSNEGSHHQQGLLKSMSINGNYNNPQRVTKGPPENVPTRSECMVESWICSSE